MFESNLRNHLEPFEEAIKLMEPIKATHNKNTTTGHIYWAALALRARVNLYCRISAAMAQCIGIERCKENHRRRSSDFYCIGTMTMPAAWAKEFTNESIFEFQTTSLYNQRNSLGYYTDPTGYAEAGMSDSFVARLC